MTAVMDFLSAAAPWIAIGLFLAVFFVQASKKKVAKAEDGEYEESYISEGMALGMCFGVAIGTALGNLTMGMMGGMLIGMLVGMCRKKQ